MHRLDAERWKQQKGMGGLGGGGLTEYGGGSERMERRLKEEGRRAVAGCYVLKQREVIQGRNRVCYCMCQRRERRSDAAVCRD